MAFWNDPSSIVPKRQYTWVVYFGNRNYNETSAYDRNQLFFGFFKTVSKPSYQLKTTQHKYLGLHEFHYPTHVTWQPVKMTLVDGYIYSFNNKNARYANYVRNEDFIWEDGKLAYKGREAVKRSAQLFFYDALREGGYTDPEEFDADTKLARFRRTVFKNDLIAASIGTNQDFTKSSDGNLINIDTKTWNTIDIVEYSNTFERSGINIKNTDPSLYSEVNAEYLKSIAEGQEYNRKQKTEEKIKNITDKYLEETKKIREFNNTNVVKQETWKLYNPIITDVNFGDLNYEQDGIVNITLTVSYDWAKLIVEDTVEQTDIKNLTKEINLPDRTSATVLQNDIDKELARSLNQRKPLPTVAQNNSFFDKAKVLVKQAEAYKSDVSKIDVTKIDTTLTDALSTTESELIEEFRDVERLATDVSEARRATADALLAVDLGSNYKLVRDEIGKRTDLTQEEKNTILSRLDYAPQYGIGQMKVVDTQFEEAYDEVLGEVAEAQARALKLAQTQEFGDKANSRLREQATTGDSIDTLSERIGTAIQFDADRKLFISKRISEGLRESPIKTLEYKDSGELIDELKKTYGSEFVDQDLVRKQLKDKAEQVYSQDIFLYRQQQDRLSELAKNPTFTEQDLIKFAKEQDELKKKIDDTVKNAARFGATIDDKFGIDAETQSEFVASKYRIVSPIKIPEPVEEKQETANNIPLIDADLQKIRASALSRINDFNKKTEELGALRLSLQQGRTGNVAETLATIDRLEKEIKSSERGFRVSEGIIKDIDSRLKRNDENISAINQSFASEREKFNKEQIARTNEPRITAIEDELRKISGLPQQQQSDETIRQFRLLAAERNRLLGRTDTEVLGYYEKSEPSISYGSDVYIDSSFDQRKSLVPVYKTDVVRYDVFDKTTGRKADYSLTSQEYESYRANPNFSNFKFQPITRDQESSIAERQRQQRQQADEARRAAQAKRKK